MQPAHFFSSNSILECFDSKWSLMLFRSGACAAPPLKPHRDSNPGGRHASEATPHAYVQLQVAMPKGMQRLQGLDCQL